MELRNINLQTEGNGNIFSEVSNSMNTSDEKHFECEICNKRFSEKSNLFKHKKTIHFGDKKYKCETCDKEFVQSSHVKRHEKAHFEGKIHECKTCLRKFSSADVLKFHQRIHSGENVYKCELCDKSFAQKGNLKRHKKIHDAYGNSQEKTYLRQSQRTYECDICCKTFASSELKKHKIIHSDQKPFQCIACNKFLIPNLLWANMKKYILE